MIARRLASHYEDVTAKTTNGAPIPGAAQCLLGLLFLSCTLSCAGTVGHENGDDNGAPVDPDDSPTTPGSIEAPTPNPSEEPATDAGPFGDGLPDVTPGPTNGTPGAAPGAPDPGTTPMPGVPVDQCADPVRDPGPAPLLRLTRRQYLNTLNDLLGDVPDLSSAFAREEVVSGIGATQGDISQVEVEEFQRAAELVSAAAVAGDALERLAPCTEARPPRDCAADFIRAFGSRAYRAPVNDATDVERHLALFDEGAKTDYRHGIELLLRGMLQSARFVYRLEFGTDEPTEVAGAPLSGHEVATRLAYAFLDTSPDPALLEAAANGKLSTADGVAEVVDALLKGDHGTAPVERFLGTLTLVDGISKLPKSAELYPEWNSDLQSALISQAHQWFEQFLASDESTLSRLLTSNTVLADARLASYYDSNGGAEFTALEDSRAAGLLTLPALLALNSKQDESSPIYRGKFVREMLLCQPPPAPPPDIPAAPEVDATASTRERLNQHVADKNCNNCHQLLDPIGFAFEHYDAIGRYRDTDSGRPIDATGELIAAGDISGPINGVVELGARLAVSPEVTECLAKQWFRHVFGRFETQADACTIQTVTEAFRAAGSDLDSLPRSIVTTDTFRFRRITSEGSN